jgi:hypothetical protein
MDYEGNLAAMVTYETRYDKISLLVLASSKYAVVAGGDEVRFRAFAFTIA